MQQDEYRKMYELERTFWWFAAKRMMSRRFLDAVLPAGPQDAPIGGREARILDAGCGTGGNLEWLSGRGRAIGVDLSDLALRLCRSRSVDEGRGEGAALGSRRPELVCGELARLPFAECSFDLVTMFDVLYHEWVEDDEAALREMARVCRPGGWILITDSAMPFLRGPHDEAYGGARRYTRRRLREVVESAGFRVRRMSYFHFLLFPLIAGVRMKERWFSSSGGAKSSLAPIHPALNRILKALSWIESLLLGLVRLPWGSSIICLAERTESGSEQAGAGM